MIGKKSVPMNGNSLAHVTSLSVQSKTKLHLCYTEKLTFVPYLSFFSIGGRNG